MTGTVCRVRRAAALGCLMLLVVGLASPGLFAQQRVGVNSAVNPNAMGIPPGGLRRRLVLGQDVVFNERITTEASGQTQYLQWGYWTGQVTNTATEGLGVARTDRAFINTWIAGTPTVNMPTSEMGSYNGAAVGTVYNDGETYLAAGKFNQQYNFSAHTGQIQHHQLRQCELRCEPRWFRFRLCRTLDGSP